MAKYEDYYKTLNPQQKEAVDTIEGPVLMIAGPGSGKTQVIAMRIANIIKQTDTPPESILAITFTESAAQNMKQRLVQLIGQRAYKVNVNTFHGFSNEVIMKYPDKFLFAKELRQLDDFNKLKILQEILDTHEFEYIKNFHSPYFYLSNIKSAISSLKKEGFTAEKFQRVIKEHEVYLEENVKINAKTSKPTKEWQDYEKLLKKNKELAITYGDYEKALKEKGFYDYEDMIIFLNEKLDDDEELLADLRENYLYLLVDEYQDTNGAQNNLVMQLAGYDEQPNLFAVGDEDQAIYSFQGANLKNILNFKEEFPAAKIITTKYNYRSRQEILDAANDVIKNNPDRFDKYFPEVTKELISANKELATHDTDSKKPITVVNTDDNYKENELVASKIDQLIKSGVKPTEIAVIYRNHNDAMDLIQLLATKQIPFTTDTGASVFSQKLVQKLINLLQYLYDPEDSQKLISILHYDNWEIELIDLYKLLRTYGQQGKIREENKDNLLDIMIEPEKLAVAGIRYPEKITDTANRLLSLQSQAHNTPLDQLLLQAIHLTGILKKSIEEKDLTTLNALNALYTFVQNQVITDPAYNLDKLILDIENSFENDLPLISETPKAFTNGVNLLTAHKSKGLEFEHVFVLKAVDKSWGNKSDRNNLKLADLYEPGPKDKKAEKESANNEERRLFFVALTRAKQQVYLSYADNYFDKITLNNRSANMTMFADEISPNLVDKVEAKKEDFTSEDLMQQFLQLQDTVDQEEKQSEEYDQETKDYLSTIIDSRLRLSASALNTYLECPHRFLYQYLLRIPKMQEKYMVLGQAVHKSLEYLGREIISGKSVDKVTNDMIIKIAQNHIEKQPLDNDTKELISNEVRKILETYLPHFREVNPPIAATEYNFPHKIYLGSIPLEGRIDAIESEDKSSDSGKKKAVIVDYKTSTPKSLNALLGNNSLNPADKNYFRQLVFYGLMAELDNRFPYEVSTVAIEFVKQTSSKKFSRQIFDIKSENIEDLKDTIKQTWANIKNLQFSKRCGRETCSICQMQ